MVVGGCWMLDGSWRLLKESWRRTPAPPPPPPPPHAHPALQAAIPPHPQQPPAENFCLARMVVEGS